MDFLKVPSALLLVFIAINQSIAQHKEAILALVQSKRVSCREIFDGRNVRSKQYVVKQPDWSAQELLLEGEYSQFSPDVWRSDVRQGKAQSVWIRDGEFAFEADKTTDNSTFEFGRLGFDEHLHTGIFESMATRNNLLLTPTHVFSVDLLDFLSVPTLKIESITPFVSQTGRQAQMVLWSMKANGTKFPRDSYGEILWLQDDGFLIERSVFLFGSRPAKSEDEGPKGFSFETQFTEVDGRLFPIRSSWREPNVAYMTELISQEPATFDRNYYTAEAIGLVTPRNPRVWRLVWFALGLIFLVMAILVLKRKWRTHAT